MNKSKWIIVFYIVLIIAGALSVVYGFLGDFTEETKALQGIAFGLGSGVVGAALAQLLTMRVNKKHPEKFHQKSIDVNDERNITIMHKSKSKIYGIETLLFPVFMIAMVALRIDFTYIACVLVFYGLRAILLIYYSNKFNKEM